VTIARAAIALVLFLLSAPVLPTQEPSLRVHFVDVGQGDGVLIQSPSGQTVVYDAGEDPARMRQYLESVGVADVRLAIASHNHADHIGGLGEVVRRFRPAFFMDNGVVSTTRTYARLLAATAAAGSQLIEPTERRIALGDASLVVIPPPGIEDWDQNDNSIGVIVEYGEFRLSLGGDAEPREWAWWMTHQRERIGGSVIHKASHHGSVNGDTGAGLARLSPRVVVVSAGAGNDYGHPHPAALRRYTEQGATVYRTDVNGTIVVEAHASGAYSVHVERGEGAQPPPAVSAPTRVLPGRRSPNR
jgi:beta-lactamase superfamily II metal-dependent hydrolase